MDDPPIIDPGESHGLSQDEDLLRGVGSGVPESAVDDPARIDRIREEFEMGFSALAHVESAVSIFGSARTPPDDPIYALARETACKLGEAGVTIITGGGPGIMQAANQGARDAGALSVGLNIELPFEQEPNEFLDISLTFEHFYSRKVMFVRYSTAFVVFPGGFGTFDEMFEALTLIQTRKIHHFPVILAGDGYWDGLMSWLRGEVVGRGNIDPDELELLRPCDTPDQVLQTVLEARAAQRVYYEPDDGKVDRGLI
ncbi:MAG TPA: TIGR00730 family Rossman fold protein [Solirubrobacterales bacterium]|nr:TIGR00730 family Rossman fold protein [Solirubrobacterales bacterium]